MLFFHIFTIILPNFSFFSYFCTMKKPQRITFDSLVGQEGSNSIIYKKKLIIADHYQREYLFVEPCRLDAITLIFVIRGKLRYLRNLKEYEATGSCILVNLPDNIVQVLSTENLEMYAVFISTDFLTSMPTDMLQRAQAYMAVNQEHRVDVPLENMASLLPFKSLVESTLSLKGPETDEVMKSLLQSFLYATFSMRNLSISNSDNKDTDSLGVSRGNRRLYDRFMEILTRYHHQERLVQFYADKLCVSPKYLSMAVKDFSGKSPSDWIADYVVAEAKSLLFYSQLSTAEVAYRLNFPSQAAFSKFFKANTGISPMKYVKGLEK